MTQKIKKQVYIDSEQDERLKRLSELLGISEDELMQRAICSYIDGEQGKRSSVKSTLAGSPGMVKELEFMESRIEGRTVGDEYPHRLTREEMYDGIMRERGLYR